MRRADCWIAIFATLFISACSRSAAPASDATVGQPGVFNFQQPAGWTNGTAEGTDKTTNSSGSFASTGPNENGFTPAIKVGVDSVFSFDSFVKIYLESVQPPGNMYLLVEQSDFVTTAGVKGVRFVVPDEAKPPREEIVTYGFPAPNGDTIRATCTCLAADDAKYRPIFDASMKTMTFGN